MYRAVLSRVLYFPVTENIGFVNWQWNSCRPENWFFLRMDIAGTSKWETRVVPDACLIANKLSKEWERRKSTLCSAL